MRKNEIEKYVQLLGRIEAAKRRLSTLKINWETDTEKMDFSKLYSFQSVKNISLAIIRIEMMPVEKMDDTLFNGEDAERMLNLIELVDSGEKIIPPLNSIDYTIKDGEKIMCSGMHPADGLHRRKLASAIGLAEIPTIVIETVRKYLFSISKWNFEYNGEQLVVKSLVNDVAYNFDFSEWFVGPSEKYEFLELTRSY